MITYLDSHSVSAEYVYWQMEEARIRAFTTSTNRGMGAWFDERWEFADSEASRIFDPEQHGEDLQAVLFDRDVGVWPSDYFWQLSSAVVKDAVALFEIFLEQMANAVLCRFGARLTNLQTENSWRWPECQAFYTHYIGVDVTPPKLEAALWIRNKLAHLRDELRTDAGRAEFAAHVKVLGIDGPETPEEAALGLVDHRAYMSHGVQLTQLQTWRLLDVIGEHVGVVALAAFPFIYGGAFNGYLAAVQAKAPLTVAGFPAKTLITL
ncbi:hypothetical protein [uncultured Microbacterium sp.]|uniref:hypothetical protein n=1 Tax=uncultured Microbacterium sp. TaxID=191216 RepID=UPI0035C9CA30